MASNLTVCNGWDGGVHLTPKDNFYFDKRGKVKSGICKDCVSKRNKQNRTLKGGSISPKRLIVDGLMLCSGIDGEDHLANYETDFYFSNGKASAKCKMCLSKRRLLKIKSVVSDEKVVEEKHNPTNEHSNLLKKKW